jgi:hypothetical protein
MSALALKADNAERQHRRPLSAKSRSEAQIKPSTPQFFWALGLLG